MNKLIIIGASGHGKVIADIAMKNGYVDIAFLDDNADIRSCGGHKVLGRSETATQYKDADLIVAIGNAEIRSKIQAQLSAAGSHIVSLIHPNAVIASSVTIGAGTVIMAGAVINPDVVIGQGCIINTCASIDHDCIIGDHVHVSVGSHLCGTVSVGSKTWIGAGATVINNVSICPNCMIGAGTVITKSIDLAGTYVGIPARKIK